MFQMIAQLQSEPLMLMSVFKIVLVLIVLGPWAWLVGRLDKDAGYYFLKQKEWAMAHIGAGVVGFSVMLLVPIFIAGFLLGLLILAGEVALYVLARNKEVPEKDRWSGMDIIKNVQAEREQKATEKAMTAAEIKLLDKDGALLEIPHGTDPRTPAFELFQNMLVFAVPRGSDQLEMTVDAEKAVFFARIDGIRYPQEAPDKALCVQLIDFMKENAGMDMADRRRKQSGKMTVEVEGYGTHKLALTTAGSTRALQLIVEIDPDGRLNIPIKKLGMTSAQAKGVKALTEENSRVVIFSSPAHTGTTTTMYSLLQDHDPYTASVMTFEKQVAFDVEGVNHQLFPEGASNEQIVSEFASLLRSDPNVVMVSQVISTDMAQMIAKQAEDTRFYLPLPAQDTISALKVWLKIVGDRKLAASSLSAIISQRLVRKLCPTCRAPYQPDAVAMKKLNMTGGGDSTLYKASGKVVVKEEESICPNCHGLGYKGRVGVYEVMLLDQEARSLIASGEGERLKSHLRKQHMVYLQEAALAKVVEGVSDIKEVTRVLAEHQKKG